LCGFWLLAEYGLTGTTRVAVGLNVAAGVLAVLFGRRGLVLPSPVTASGPAMPVADAGPRIYVGLAFTIGMISLAAQYLWARSLIFAFDRLKNTTYSFSVVLAVCLAGIVIGTALVAVLVDRVRDRRRLLAVLTLLLGLAIGASALLQLRLQPLQDRINLSTLEVDFPAAVRQAGVRTIVVIGLPTLLAGMILPVCVRAAADSARVARSVGSVYAANSFGCVAGSVLAAFLLTPLFGLLKSLLVLATIALVTGVLLWTGRRSGIAAIAAGSVAVVLIKLLPGSWALDTLLEGEHVVRSTDGSLATVSVVENTRGERRISVDDVPVAGTSLIMQTDQKSLAHWGMLLADNPRTALTVGFGSGGASWSFLLHDRLQQLDCVEICPDVPRAADLLTDANHGLLQQRPPDPRYRLIIADARSYLRTTNMRYDVIVSDCTDLRYRSSANLYDLQYFQYCREALTDGGCTVIWMPLGGLSREAFLLTLRTFAHVFPDMQVWYLHNRWTHYVLLAGHRTPFTLRPERLQQLFSEADVKQDLAVIGFEHPEKVAATFLTTASLLRVLRESSDLNTEENPRLEFLVPRFDTGPWSAQVNLNLLRRHRSPASTLWPDSLPADDRARYQRFSDAAVHILAAQEAERKTDVDAATTEYLAARALTPEDAAIDRALQFDTLREAADSGHPTASLLLGRSLLLQSRYRDAESRIQQYFDRRAELQTRQQNGDRFSNDELQQLTQAEAWTTTATRWLQEARAGHRPSP
jgi:spermidine synthase